jgi:hypothetical protein
MAKRIKKVCYERRLPQQHPFPLYNQAHWKEWQEEDSRKNFVMMHQACAGGGQGNQHPDYGSAREPMPSMQHFFSPQQQHHWRPAHEPFHHFPHETRRLDQHGFHPGPQSVGHGFFGKRSHHVTECWDQRRYEEWKMQERQGIVKPRTENIALLKAQGANKPRRTQQTPSAMNNQPKPSKRRKSTPANNPRPQAPQTSPSPNNQGMQQTSNPIRIERPKAPTAASTHTINQPPCPQQASPPAYPPPACTPQPTPDVTTMATSTLQPATQQASIFSYPPPAFTPQATPDLNNTNTASNNPPPCIPEKFNPLHPPPAFTSQHTSSDSTAMASNNPQAYTQQTCIFSDPPPASASSWPTSDCTIQPTNTLPPCIAQTPAPPYHIEEDSDQDMEWYNLGDVIVHAQSTAAAPCEQQVNNQLEGHVHRAHLEYTEDHVSTSTLRCVTTY